MLRSPANHQIVILECMREMSKYKIKFNPNVSIAWVINYVWLLVYRFNFDGFCSWVVSLISFQDKGWWHWSSFLCKAGPQCVLSCATEHRALPKQGFACCLAMDGVKVLASGFDADEKVPCLWYICVFLTFFIQNFKKLASIRYICTNLKTLY